MEISLESKLKNALEREEAPPTPSCPDIDSIGAYIEGVLPERDKAMLEEHLGSCAYCLNQLIELKVLLHYQKKGTALPSELLKRIELLCPEEGKPIPRILDRIARLITFPVRQWRYAAVSVVSASLAILLSLLWFVPERGMERLSPAFTSDALVYVNALDSNGRVIRESQGAILGAHGLVAANLSTLIGASSVQIRLKDGKTYTVKGLWKDDGKNLALMKIEDGLSTPASVTDIKDVNIGEKVFILTDPAALKKGMAEAVITDLKSSPARRGIGDIEYIQLATITAHYNQGVVVDSNGRIVGLLITGERNISLAASLYGLERIVSEQKPMPISSLKDLSLSPDALNYYFKGILARNTQDYDKAIEYLKKAIELNPDLEDAHLELGFLYYKKQLFDLERREYEEALRINPKNTDALFYLATNMETMGEYDEAIRIYERIVSLDPHDGDAYYELGLAYLAKGEKAKTLKVCNLLQRIDPGLAEKLRRISYAR